MVEVLELTRELGTWVFLRWNGKIWIGDPAELGFGEAIEIGEANLVDVDLDPTAERGLLLEEKTFPCHACTPDKTLSPIVLGKPFCC